jgi:hypothetical protein
MNRIQALLRYIFGSQAGKGPAQDPLDYEQVVHLDAEDLAELGIQLAYVKLLPQLRQYTASTVDVAEEIDSSVGSYAVLARGERHEIWAPSLDPNEGWARATVAFFAIANAGLSESPFKFYALYGGNDLSGLFLTEEECLLARQAIKQRSYWPYLPVSLPPHYGFPGASAA